MPTGTSRALPKPKPTRPAPSPTTVSAVKPNCLPPLTTLATRFTATSFSSRSSPDIGFSTLAICLQTLWLELETRFASGLCQRFDAPVIHETGTVEGDLCNPLGLGALCDCAADSLGSLDVAGGFQRTAHVLLQGRRGNQNFVALGSEDLRIDVLGRPVHRQAQRGELFDLHSAPARTAQTGILFGQFHVLTSSSPLSAKSFHRSTSRPCPCRAPAAGSREFPPQSGPPAEYRCP